MIRIMVPESDAFYFRNMVQIIIHFASFLQKKKSFRILRLAYDFNPCRLSGQLTAQISPNWHSEAKLEAWSAATLEISRFLIFEMKLRLAF